MVDVPELNQRALRVIQTRLSNFLGDVSAEETTKFLVLELSEVDEPMNLIGALAAAGAVAIIVGAHGMGVAPEELIAEIRAVMAPG